MREKWRELMGKMYGGETKLDGRSDEMDAVLAEMRMRQQQRTKAQGHSQAPSRSASATTLGSSAWGGMELGHHNRNDSMTSECVPFPSYLET
jgi:hypothetical protein